MSLVDLLIATLGTSTAKVILFLWSRDENLLSDAATSLVDVFGNLGVETIARRRGIRQFEHIAERIAERILPAFEVEFQLHKKKMSDTEFYVPVIEALEDSISISELDPEKLLGLDLSYDELLRYINERSPVDRFGLSEEQKTLYHRVLIELCKYIVYINFNLPSFYIDTLSAILQREREIHKSVEDALQKIDNIGMHRQNSELTSKRFRSLYINAIINQLDKIELFGYSKLAGGMQQQLSVAYVSLSMRLDERQKRISLNDAIQSSKYLAIKGDAGSGKTTILKWIAVIASRQQKADNPLENPFTLENTRKETPTKDGSRSKFGKRDRIRKDSQLIEKLGWRSKMPFFLRLRNYSNEEFPTPRKFVDKIAYHASGMMKPDWVENLLIEGQAIVLIDGIDEVSPSRREEVKTWIEGLISTYPESNYIVTSRPASVDQNWLLINDFAVADLLPMKLTDLEIFVKHWHDAMAQHNRADLTLLRQKNARLTEVISNNFMLMNLATNPLMCSLICALNFSDGYLPQNRHILYEQCCKLLIESLDKARQIPYEGYPNLNYEQKLSILSDIAYFLIINNKSEMDIDDLHHRLRRSLRLLGIYRDENEFIESIIDLLVQRTAMLTEIGGNVFSFTHRSFQEYLAARATLDEGNVGQLIVNCDNDHWREVTILATAQSRRIERSRIIAGILERGFQSPENEKYFFLLSIACLEGSQDLDEDVREKIAGVLGTLVPPSDKYTARTLSYARSMLLPLLGNWQGESDEIVSSCIHCLCLIGGDEALEILTTYIEDKRPTVASALLNARDYFRSSKFDQMILGGLGLVKLDVDDRNDFQYMKDLGILHSNGKLASLSPLAGMLNVVHLNLSYCFPIDESDLQIIASLIYLVELRLYWCLDTDNLKPLSNLTHLRKLNLYAAEKVDDITPIENMTRLEYLDISDTIVSDVHPLSQLTRLKHLSLSGTAISDISPLHNLIHLESLELQNCYELNGIEIVLNFPNLKYLDVRGTDINVNDLEPLREFVQIVY